MDHLRRQRRGAATGDPELGAAPTEPDYATALSPEGSLPAGESRYGEASPSTLEQGGAFVPEPVAAAEMIGPVASPFHSERVKQEVALEEADPELWTKMLEGWVKSVILALVMPTCLEEMMSLCTLRMGLLSPRRRG